MSKTRDVFAHRFDTFSIAFNFNKELSQSRRKSWFPCAKSSIMVFIISHLFSGKDDRVFHLVPDGPSCVWKDVVSHLMSCGYQLKKRGEWFCFEVFFGCYHVG